MKLKVKRSQKSGMMGGITFVLEVRAELEEIEKANIKKYKLGTTMLYERNKITDPGSGAIGFASRMAYKMTNITITVNDLETGKKVECKDILEMLAVEEQVKDAARTFKAVLNAASTFDGEEIVSLD